MHVQTFPQYYFCISRGCDHIFDNHSRSCCPLNAYFSTANSESAIAQVCNSVGSAQKYNHIVYVPKWEADLNVIL